MAITHTAPSNMMILVFIEISFAIDFLSL
jgi:hypothetical protein